jgi:YidC/Oxa1 family membrane protein insertase
MPNTRVMLWVALAAILFLNYEAWMRDYPASTFTGTTASTIGGAATSGSLGESVPQANSPQASGTSSAVVPTTGTQAPPNPQSPAPLGGTAPTPTPASLDSAVTDTGTAHPGEPPLHVVTDVLDVAINLKGGELDRADILQYPLHKDTPNIPVRLENGDSEDSLYLLQTGLTGEAGEAAPTHLATWTSAEKSYVLPAGAEELRVPLTWTDGHGLTITKT